MNWKTLTGCLTAVCMVAASVSLAEEWTTGLPSGVDLKPLQLFSIETFGPSAFDEDDEIQEFGTGFAIAEDVIITARHVTKSIDDFANTGDDKLPIPDRTVKLMYVLDEGRRAQPETNSDLWVTPSPVISTDAARLDLVTLKDAEPLPLSVCDIVPGETYYLMKFRRDRQGNGKNINIPKAIKITADEDIAARKGNLHLFRHGVQDPKNLDRPIGGDSGSPVLDKNGHVVGLLSAIQGSSYLWVTPTKSFFDLIPASRQAEVVCVEEFTALFDTTKRIDFELERLQASIAEAERKLTERYDARIAELDKALVDKVKELAAVDAELRAKDEEQRKRNERQDKDITDAELRSTSMLTAMLLEAEQRGAITKSMLNDTLRELRETQSSSEIDPSAEPDEQAREVLKKSLQALFNQKPVFPEMTRMNEELDEVSRMKSELGVPKWGFDTRQDPGLDRLVFKVGYMRQISLAPVTENMVLCARPMLDFTQPDKRLDKAKDDYINRNFYEASDQIFDNSGLTDCEWRGQPNVETKSAVYSFPIKTTFLGLPQGFDHLELTRRPERFYAYTYDLDNRSTEEGKVAALHRFILEIDRSQDIVDVSCYYFPEEIADDPYDYLAKFAANEDADIKENHRCPDLQKI